MYAVIDTETSTPIGVFNSKSIAQARLAFKAHIRCAELGGAQSIAEISKHYTIEEVCNTITKREVLG